MKLRMKIITTIMSMCLAIGVMGFAVFAAATQTLTVTNTVNFVSEHVLATVTGTVTNATGSADYAATSTLANEADGKLGTWAIGTGITFTDETQLITITLTVVNNNLERAFSIGLSAFQYTTLNGPNLGTKNITRACSIAVAANATPINIAAWEGAAQTVEVGSTAVVTITLDISDNGKEVDSFDNGFTVTLLNIA
ncbi:MAG: hypothetical protein WCR30_04300 [Clostridia bacterium]